MTEVNMASDPADIDLLKLVDHQKSVQGSQTVEEVYQWFQKHTREYVGVLDGKRWLGLVSRGQIGFLLGARFGFAIYSRQPIQGHLMEAPLVVKRGAPLLAVLEAALSRQGESFYDDVALIGEDGEYYGIITVPTLVRWQSKLIQEKTQLAEQQQRVLQESNRQLFRSVNELRQSQGRYEILFQNSALGVALLDSHGTIETCNRRLELLLRKDEEREPFPDNLGQMVPASEKEAFLGLLRQHEENPTDASPRTTDHTLNLPGQGPRLFRFHTSWVRETGQVCAMLDDITEQRVLEHRLIQREKSALLDSLVGGIAHEINNKLAPIVGYAELLLAQVQRIPEAGQLSVFCTTIRDSAVESAKIIRQLLHLSRPMALEISACDLCALVKEVLALLRFRLRQTDCRVDLDLPTSEVPARVDAGQIKQVLINLMLNALDAMEGAAQKTLRISVRQAGQKLLLQVADTGCGIPPELASRIFDPFFTTKSAERGSGLGLSVCLSVVKNHGGEITFSSKVGEGTEFSVSLPVKSTAPEGSVRGNGERRFSERMLSRALSPSTKRLNVLIVDDEEFITAMLQEILRVNLHCRVERVDSGHRAIGRLQQADFDLVISDVRMPGVDGFGLYEWVLKNQPALSGRFLFITGDAGSHELNERIKSIGVPVLRKPFEVADLMGQCSALVEDFPEAEVQPPLSVQMAN